jgi:hypothetical protein
MVGCVLGMDGSGETTVRPHQDDSYLVVIWVMFSTSQASAGSDTFQCWKQAHVHHYKRQGSMQRQQAVVCVGCCNLCLFHRQTTVRTDQDDAYLVVIWVLFSTSQASVGSDTFQCWKQAHVHHYKKQGSWRCVGVLMKFSSPSKS